MVYDLGSADRVWRDLYLSGSTIHLGNATIHESDGNVVISKLNVSGSIIADGLTPDLIITSIQITNANWEPIDDTAISSSGGYLIVYGAGFAPGSLVKIADTNAVSTGYVDATQLRVQVGARTPGTYNLHVIRADTKTSTLPSAIHISDSVTWITSSNLGTVSYQEGFSIPLQATSDSQVTYSANTLPPETSLNQTTGLLEGNITTVDTSTLYSFDISAVDAELQDSVRTFLLQLIVVLLYSTQYTDASWTPIAQTALDSNAANVYWTIDGVGMSEVTSVLVDGTPATSVSVVSDSVVRVQGPQKPRGTYDVTLVTPLTTKVFPNSVVYSDVPTWVTPVDLGNVSYSTPFTIPILATSDSEITNYDANVSTLPPDTTLIGSNLTGNIVNWQQPTQYDIQIYATDTENQRALRTFVLDYIGIYVTSLWHSLTFASTNSFSIMSDGRVFGWGPNNYQQLARPDLVTGSPVDLIPYFPAGVSGVKEVASGGSFTYFRTLDDRWFSCGRIGMESSVVVQILDLILQLHSERSRLSLVAGWRFKNSSVIRGVSSHLEQMGHCTNGESIIPGNV